MTVWELKRRAFLRAIGVGAGMLPVLAETRHAAAASGLGRLITVVKGNGTRAETFWPTGAGAGGSLVGAVFPHVSAPLQELRDKLLFLDGITLRNWLKSEGNTTGDNGDAHHNWGSLLTGTLPGPATSTDGGCRLNAGGCHMGAGSASLDCFVGQALRKKDPGLAFDSLHLSLNVDDISTARRGSGMNCPSWFDKDLPNAPEPDVKAAFTKIFGGRQLSTPGSANETLWRKRVRLLDFVGKDLERFAKNLGTEDREAAGAHLASVHRRQDELNRLLSSPPAVCKTPAAPTLDYLVKSEANVPAQSKLMMDMLVDAMKCGITRSACYSLYDTNGYNAYFSWLKNINANLGSASISEFNASHMHAMAHSSGQEPGMTMYRDANRWLFEQYAYLVKRLAAEQDQGGTMLDNTVVLYADTLSDGGGHQVTRLPWVMAGNVNGFFKAGRHVKLSADTAPNGLFAAIAEAVGASDAGSGFGDPKFGLGAYAPLRG